MMTSLLRDAATVEFTGNEPWPDNVNLFQPYEAGQILLTDYAQCLSVKAFLKFNDLKYLVELRKNAEYISPSGKVPFLQIGKVLVSEFDPIVAFVKAKGIDLSADLKASEVAEMKAYCAMIENILVNAELYLSWCEDSVVQVTKQRYGSPFSWPINSIIPWMKQREARRHLAALGWVDDTMEEVSQKVHTCCQALSQKLGEKPYFFGDKPTELDALVFGHLFTIITTELPAMDLADVVETYQNLVNFCTRIDEQFFQDPATSPS